MGFDAERVDVENLTVLGDGHKPLIFGWGRGEISKLDPLCHVLPLKTREP